MRISDWSSDVCSSDLPKLDLYELATGYRDQHGGLEYLVCDEAQFYTDAQAEQLARVVDELDADVHALGLLTDFRGRLFAGSARFLGLATERPELRVEVGRASSRGRGGQKGEISEDAGQLTKKTIRTTK